MLIEKKQARSISSFPALCKLPTRQAFRLAWLLTAHAAAQGHASFGQKEKASTASPLRWTRGLHSISADTLAKGAKIGGAEPQGAVAKVTSPLHLTVPCCFRHCPLKFVSLSPQVRVTVPSRERHCPLNRNANIMTDNANISGDNVSIINNNADIIDKRSATLTTRDSDPSYEGQ